MKGDSTLFVAVIAGLLGPLVTYLIAARRFSGSVRTSEATKLWDEARKIREDYRSRITELNGTIDRCEERIRVLENRNDKLWLENSKLKHLIEQHGLTLP